MAQSRTESWWDSPEHAQRKERERKRNLWRGRVKAASPVSCIDPVTGEVTAVIAVTKGIAKPNSEQRRKWRRRQRKRNPWPGRAEVITTPAVHRDIGLEVLDQVNRPQDQPPWL